MSATIGGLSLLLCFLHYASVAWPSIAYRPEIARPLRLDRPDSFGRLYSCMLLAGSAGISLLTYQLRRYRIDDYQGRYRLWRLILIVLVLASINTLVSIIQWGGALLDAGFGRRVALTGGDWLRLVVSIGGAIVALRLCAEVRRCRWALVSMIIACGLLAIPEAAKWNFIAVESITAWTLVTSAPLLAFTMLFISLAGYLRMLYREVRQIEDGGSLAVRVNQFRLRILNRADRDDDDQADDGDAEEKITRPTRSPNESKRGWFRRGSGKAAASKPDRRSVKAEKATQPATPPPQPQTANAQSGPRQADDRDKAETAPSARRWFGLRRAKPESSDTKAGKGKPDNGQKSPPSDAAAAKKRSRFSVRLDPASRDAKAERSETRPQNAPQGDAESSDTPTKKRGLGGWLRPKKGSDGEDSPSDKPPGPAAPTSSERGPEDDIDWDSLSKSERRRLRKQLRRQGGQAA